MLSRSPLASSESDHTLLRLRLGERRAAGIPRDARLCKLCHLEVESKEYYVHKCPVYNEIRGRYHYLLERFIPLSRVINNHDQRCLGLFLMKLRTHIEITIDTTPRPNSPASSRWTQSPLPLMRMGARHQITDTQQGLTIERASELRALTEAVSIQLMPTSQHVSRIDV